MREREDPPLSNDRPCTPGQTAYFGPNSGRTTIFCHILVKITGLSNDRPLVGPLFLGGGGLRLGRTATLVDIRLRGHSWKLKTAGDGGVGIKNRGRRGRCGGRPDNADTEYGMCVLFA